VGIATVPGWGATGRLAAIVGPARAKQLILTGEPIDAQTAATWGLVGEVVPAADLAERARALAMRVADQAPIAVQIAKQLIDGQRHRPVIAIEALGGGLTAFTTDAEEGRAAFRERRRPDYGDV
jgi:enoyl-CoA hydratase/carnithine racemase